LSSGDQQKEEYKNTKPLSANKNNFTPTDIHCGEIFLLNKMGCKDANLV
jgi:hypothetical protein